MDLDSLQAQFHGRKFGELILEHHKKLDLGTTLQALRGITQELPAGAEPLIESWIDYINPGSRIEQFWQQDCGVAFVSITTAAAAKLRGAGVEPSSDDLFNMFQIIVLNFAYASHVHPQSKAFIQKAVGIGFLSRLFSAERGKKPDFINTALLEKLAVQHDQAQEPDRRPRSLSHNQKWSVILFEMETAPEMPERAFVGERVLATIGTESNHNWTGNILGKSQFAPTLIPGSNVGGTMRSEFYVLSSHRKERLPLEGVPQPSIFAIFSHPKMTPVQRFRLRIYFVAIRHVDMSLVPHTAKL